MGDYIDIRKINFDELSGVVSIYPWFAAARVELCRRMLRSGGYSEAQFADAAFYIVDRRRIAAMIPSDKEQDMKDADVEMLVKSCLAEETEAAPEKKRIYAVGGDYFSQAEYDNVRRSDDNVFSRYADKAKQEAPALAVSSEEEFDLYTETLAQIYAEQGYYEHAKTIYSKLILAYPEKNAYFAALIRKIEEINS